jgi:hypothetical protein
MNRTTRSRLEMGARALEFSRAHPDDSPGYSTVLSQLAEQLAISQQLADQQRAGIAESRSATARKGDLRRAMSRRQLVHLSRVARRAAKDEPELARKFELPRDTIPYLAFTSLARTMVAEAQRHKELLVKHGLVERVLDSLTTSLDKFDRAVVQGAEGRRLHIGAGANLDVAAKEVVELVKVIDGLNRFRFADDADLSAAWEAASNVIGPPRPTEKPTSPNTLPTGGEVRPAA